MSWPLASFALVGLVLLGGWLAYERSRPSARMVAVVATLAAVAALGRDAFVALPEVKPITAIVLVVGYVLGPLPGFTVGAVGMLASNVMLGQGSYTPWQMAAWGMVGVAGAVLGRLTGRRLGRLPLALACGLAALAATEVMNVYTWTLGASHTLAAFLLIAGATALSFNLVDAGASFLFGLAFAPELARVLARMRARMDIRWEAAGAGAPPLAETGTLAERGMLVERGMLAGGECLPASVKGECLPASVEGECLPASVEGECLPASVKGECLPASVVVVLGLAGALLLGGGSARANFPRPAGVPPATTSPLVAPEGLSSAVPFAAAPAAVSPLVASMGFSSVPPFAVATASAARVDVSREVGYLTSAQDSDGGWGPAAGQPPSELYSAWAAIGLAAAGRPPQSVRRDGYTVLEALRAQAGTLEGPGDLERTMLALRACGAPVGSLAGKDLLEGLLRYRASDGSFASQVNLTAFAVFALRAAGYSATDPAVRAAGAWIAGQQDSDGGFNFAGRGGSSDVDDTAAALQGLIDAGIHSGAGVSRAVAFLVRAQNPDGGFPEQPGGESNAQSTAWAVQGLVAAGRNVEAVRRRGSRTPLGYLESLVAPNGSVRYSRTSAQTPVWVTAQALTALARAPFPIG